MVARGPKASETSLDIEHNAGEIDGLRIADECMVQGIAYARDLMRQKVRQLRRENAELSRTAKSA